MSVVAGVENMACIGLVFKNGKSYEETSLSEGDTSIFSMKNIRYKLVSVATLRILIRKLFFINYLLL